MKKIFLNLALTSALVVGMQSCHNVSRVDVDSTMDISGKWNDVDSRLTAETLTEQILGELWLNQFKKENQRKPVVIVGFVFQGFPCLCK